MAENICTSPITNYAHAPLRVSCERNIYLRLYPHSRSTYLQLLFYYLELQLPQDSSILGIGFCTRYLYPILSYYLFIGTIDNEV